MRGQLRTAACVVRPVGANRRSGSPNAASLEPYGGAEELTVRACDDPLERETDRVADAVRVTVAAGSPTLSVRTFCTTSMTQIRRSSARLVGSADRQRRRVRRAQPAAQHAGLHARLGHPRRTGGDFWPHISGGDHLLAPAIADVVQRSGRAHRAPVLSRWVQVTTPQGVDGATRFETGTKCKGGGYQRVGTTRSCSSTAVTSPTGPSDSLDEGAA